MLIYTNTRCWYVCHLNNCRLYQTSGETGVQRWARFWINPSAGQCYDSMDEKSCAHVVKGRDWVRPPRWIRQTSKKVLHEWFLGRRALTTSASDLRRSSTSWLKSENKGKMGCEGRKKKKKDGLLSALIKRLNQSDILVQPQEGNIMIFPHYIHCL